MTESDEQGNSPETRYEQFFHKLNERNIYGTDLRTGNELCQALLILMQFICKTMAKFSSKIKSEPRT